jgi:Zn-finger nucleic acid-binding protein
MRSSAQKAESIMNCPSCGVFLDADQTAGSETHHLPDCPEDTNRKPEIGARGSQECPLCKVALVHAAIANVLVQCCVECRGMLIPMHVFQHIIESLEFPIDATLIELSPGSSDLNREIYCPYCRRRMDTHPYRGAGDAIIDTCVTCSLNWLDRGELMQIVHVPDGRVRTHTEWA